MGLSPVFDPVLRLLIPFAALMAGVVCEGLDCTSLDLPLALPMLATPCAQRLKSPVPVNRPDAGRPAFCKVGVWPEAAEPPAARPLTLDTLGVVRLEGTVPDTGMLEPRMAANARSWGLRTPNSEDVGCVDF